MSGQFMLLQVMSS